MLHMITVLQPHCSAYAYTVLCCRIKHHQVKGRVEVMEMSHERENLQSGVVAEHNAETANAKNNDYDMVLNTENIYEEVGDVSVQYERVDTGGEVTANPLVTVDEVNDEQCKVSLPDSDMDDAIDIYEHIGTDDGVTIDHFSKADIGNRSSGNYI